MHLKSLFVSSVFTTLLILTVFTNVSEQSSLDEDLTLTYKQKLILDKFKEEVTPLLPHDYMKEDIYLVRWLRAKNFDLKQAEIGLFENLQWRENNKMDTIIHEDWSDFEAEYPYFLEGCDYEGRPVASVHVGDWNVRKVVLAGKRDMMIRYAYKLWEEIHTLIREGQKLGRNVTQYDILLDMTNFNLAETACAGCLPVYMALTSSYEARYPGGSHKTIIVNAPQIYQETFTLLRPLMTPSLRKSIHVFGPNKRQWEPFLFNEIPREQLTKSFGGLKEHATSPEELRTRKEYPC